MLVCSWAASYPKPVAPVYSGLHQAVEKCAIAALPQKEQTLA
jgi:hypothetical protein